MSLVPVEGQTYRYTGDLRSHRGLYGVASNIYPVGRLYRLTLSNHADWTRCGLAPSLECLSSEISPAEPAEPLHPMRPSAIPNHVAALSHLAHVTALDRLASEGDAAFAPAPLEQFKTTTDDLPKRTVTVERDLFRGPEKELVKASCDWLTKNGFAWAVAGQLKAKGSGTTVGLPDLWVRHPAWPRGLWVAIELKTATGTLSPEQDRLHREGGSHVCRSVGQVSDVMYAVHAALCGWLALVKYR